MQTSTERRDSSQRAGKLVFEIVDMSIPGNWEKHREAEITEMEEEARRIAAAVPLD